MKKNQIELVNIAQFLMGALMAAHLIIICLAYKNYKLIEDMFYYITFYIVCIALTVLPFFLRKKANAKLQKNQRLLA